MIQQQDQCDEVCSAEHDEEQLHACNEEEQLSACNEEEQLRTRNEKEQLSTLDMLPLPLTDYFRKALNLNGETDTLSSAE